MTVAGICIYYANEVTAFNTILYFNDGMAKPDRPANLSSLTRIQMETLRIHLEVRKSSVNIQEALKIRKGSGISRGTYYRILAQARKNIRQSLFTVVVMLQLGVLKPDDVQKLVAAISVIPQEVEEEKYEEVLAIVGTLIDRIVML